MDWLILIAVIAAAGMFVRGWRTGWEIYVVAGAAFVSGFITGIHEDGLGTGLYYGASVAAMAALAFSYLRPRRRAEGEEPTPPSVGVTRIVGYASVLVVASAVVFTALAVVDVTSKGSRLWRVLAVLQVGLIVAGFSLIFVASRRARKDRR